MKKIIDKILNISYKFIIIFTIICFSIALIGSIFFYVNRSHNYLNPLILIIGTFIYILLLSKLYKYIKNKTENKKLITIILIIEFILLFILSSLIISIPKVDLLHILTGINSLNNTSTIINNEYFSIYPNNKFLFMILYYLQILLPNYNRIIFNIFSSLSITIMSLYIYKSIKMISNKDNALLGLIITVTQPIFYLYASYCYTDVFILPFTTILFYLIIKTIKTNKLSKSILYSILIGILSIIGYKIRAIAIFVLVAYFVYLIFNKCIKSQIKNIFVIFISLILTLSLINISENKFFKQNDNSKEFPLTHWIMMGSNEEKNGFYNQSDYLLSYNTKNINERKELNKKVIKERIKKQKVFKNIKLIITKIYTVWSKGDYSYQKYLELVNNYNFLYKYVIEDKNIIINYILQINKISIIMLSIISLIKIYKSKKVSILSITLFGSIIFYLIWEVCPRYGLSFLPWLIIISSYSYEFIKFKYIEKSKTIKYVILIISLITLLCFFNKCTNLSYKNDLVAKDTTKKIKEVSLNKDNVIEEELLLNNKFNKLKLMFNIEEYKEMTNNDKEELNDDIYLLEIINIKDKIIYKEEFNKDNIKNNKYTTFNFKKTLSKGKYKIRLSTKSKNKINVILSYKEQFDFYPYGTLKINDKSIDGDLMFECIYYNKRGTFKIYEYILLIFVIMFIEYLILFKKEKKNNAKKFRSKCSKK